MRFFIGQLEEIPGQLEASFLIFLTLGSIKQSNTHTVAGASDIVRAESSGEDPWATGDLVSNLPHPRVNKKKQHTSFLCLPTNFLRCTTYDFDQPDWTTGRGWTWICRWFDGMSKCGQRGVLPGTADKTFILCNRQDHVLYSTFLRQATSALNRGSCAHSLCRQDASFAYPSQRQRSKGKQCGI